MKTSALIIAFLFFWPFGGGKTFRMVASRDVPAAHGSVIVKKDTKNHNVDLTVKVRDLAKPATLTPPEDVYIVWVEPRDAPPQKEGAIEVSGNSLQGQLTATTTARQFKLVITAEKSLSANQPSSRQVLWADVSP